MNIDFPLILTVAVLLSGGIWLAHHLRVRFHPNREAGSETPAIVEHAQAFFPVLFIVWALRSFLAEPFQIPSESMLPALEIGDFVLVNKYTYGVRLPVLKTQILPVGKPQRGDIMVFIPPHKDLYLIKRVIGLPGDVIGYADQSLTVNGQALDYRFVGAIEQVTSAGRFPVREYEESLSGATYRIRRYPPGLIRQPPARQWTVPPGSYFTLGDNRDRSEDSRVWGFAHEEEIVGKAVAVWMHKEPGWHLPTFARNRWLSAKDDAPASR